MSERDERDAPTWGERWRLSPRPSDGLRLLRCLLRGHRWTVNERRSQRVCHSCFTIQERTFPPHEMERHGSALALHSPTCWCRDERGPDDRGWVYEHRRECAECGDESA